MISGVSRSLFNIMVLRQYEQSSCFLRLLQPVLTLCWCALDVVGLYVQSVNSKGEQMNQKFAVRLGQESGINILLSIIVRHSKHDRDVYRLQVRKGMFVNHTMHAYTYSNFETSGIFRV